MKNFLTLTILTIHFISCEKSPQTTDETFFIIPDPQYQACDTTLGYATAIKNSRVWVGGAHSYYFTSNGVKSWNLVIEACNSFEDIRERILFANIVDGTSPVGRYEAAAKAVFRQKAGSYFSTWLEDGDVPENLYKPDSSSHKNVFTIDKWDETTKEAEGSFSVTYDLAVSYSPTGGAKQFRIHSGKFRVTIPD